MKLRRFNQSAGEFSAEFGGFLARRRQGGQPDVEAAAAAIVTDVRQHGAAAIARYTQEFDGLSLNEDTLASPAIDLAQLARACDDDVRAAIDHAADRIERYHATQQPSDGAGTESEQIRLSWRWTPIPAVGVYVPGGRASYPSTVLMNVIPARVAGVERVVMVAPTRAGELNPAVAYAAMRAGVTEFYPIGGAQAVAALAYGAGPLEPVNKIVGPGNAYVAAAKRLVFGQVGIDSIAGPSELTVVAGDENRPDWAAADLLSQAEHDPLAQSILVTDSEAFAAAVEASIAEQLSSLATETVAREALAANGAIVLSSREHFAAIVNQIAPEHVEVAIEPADAVLADITNAGAIFIGAWACEALGDYLTGSNHVLPTSGAARFSSGLSTSDFMKRTSIQHITRSGFQEIAASAETLANAEGLPAHALSVHLRRAEK